MLGVLELFIQYFYIYRSKLERDKDRDISEKIALGIPGSAPSQESMFDQRLFNQTQVQYTTTAAIIFALEVLLTSKMFSIAHFNAHMLHLLSLYIGAGLGVWVGG